MNVLVTGATGFIGSNLCRELIKTNKTFGLSKSGNTERIKDFVDNENFTLLVGDIGDPDFLQKIIKENSIETVFHMAAFIPKGESDKENEMCVEINEKGTMNVVKASYSGGVKNFIYSSTMSVYSSPPESLPVNEEHPTEPSSAYGQSKLSGGNICKEYSDKMKVTILRYSGVYGPGQQDFRAIPIFIKSSIDNKPIVLDSDGTQTSDFVYVKDVAKANILSIGKSGVFNIGCGEETSIKTLAEKIVSLCNSNSDIMYSKTKSSRPFRFAYDISKAKKELGFKPTPLESGLLEFIKYIMNESNSDGNEK